MKNFFILFVAWILSLSSFAVNDNDWNLYLSYSDALSNISVGEEVYANFGGNLLAYRPSDGEVKFFSKMDGLNGQKITAMAYSETEKCLVLVYSDLLVDLLFLEDNYIIAIPQFKNSNMDGLVLNHLFVEGENAMLSFNGGVALLNLRKQNVIGFYAFDEEIKSAACHNSRLYAATEKQLLVCPMTGNPLDRNEWKSVQLASFRNFVACGKELYGVTDKKVEGGLTTGLWIAGKDGISFQQITERVFPNVVAKGEKLVLADCNNIQIYDMDQPSILSKEISFNNSWKGIGLDKAGVIWASDGFNGMQAYQISEETLKPKGEAVGNYGPKRDLCYFMKYFGNRLLIGGGRLDPMDRLHYPGTIMEFTDGKWKKFQEDGISAETKVPYRDVTSVVVDPKDANHVIASTGGTGLYDFENYKYREHISNHNSPLTSAADNNPKYVRVDGLIYDEEGNLWMVDNSQSDTILRVRRPDGSWKGFFAEGLMHAPTCEKTLIDRKGQLWVASRRTVSAHDGGLLCLDYNGTVDNTKDDIATYRSYFVNQDGKDYKVEGVYSMAEDRDGSIWVGTRIGLFVVSDPENWHSSNFRVVQVKVPRNDGTNLADYLLADMMITAIAVDGANRKWIAAEGSGLYLVSPDGTQILEHFDESNSMLLSNNIYAIAPNLETGEIMIGTDRGICSYRSSATLPEASLDKNKVKVYPNPVRPEFNGNLTVTGLTDNAEVKVMTTSGDVVAVGSSTGGSFVWDVRGGDGARVAAGVYYLMISTSDGKKGIAAKFVVI